MTPANRRTQCRRVCRAQHLAAKRRAAKLTLSCTAPDDEIAVILYEYGGKEREGGKAETNGQLEERKSGTLPATDAVIRRLLWASAWRSRAENW